MSVAESQTFLCVKRPQRRRAWRNRCFRRLGLKRCRTKSLLGQTAIHIPVKTVNSSVPELEVYLTSTYSKKAPSTLSLNLAHQNLKNKKSSESRGNFKGNKQAVQEIITTNQHNLHVRIKKTSLDINHCSLA